MGSKPLHDRVVIRRISEEKTAAGIIIPIRPRKNRRMAKLFRSAPAAATRRASSFHWTSRPAIACRSVNAPAPRSRSAGRTC